MPEEQIIPTGIVIHCSDPRDPLWKLIKKLLISPGKFFVQLALLGYPICLAHQMELAHDFHGLMHQIHFALDTFPGIKEIILVGHNCGYYKRILHKTFTLQEKEHDVIIAAAYLRSAFPNLKVSAYFKYPHAGLKKIS